ncbi:MULTISPECIES: hypothetical protein [Pelosinus]|uniref:Uncharacterized protein n=1 Tax=Pelosinus fermentans B4 TaxID=1149862 RepID=I9LGQ1_9FIRM|nr:MULTISPECIES: hypothetical protein [Pelosinus]MDF2636931.1 hypothetical protein [Pelosinus sp.]EIW19546.1 hypothetical protein FB4_2729 [Pelosinus fermentans B4]EIW24721.1 hypothetical protein FA11_3112 [Pelosinus fermentans A11]OAM95998.1 hypothetical protein FR7_04020 [Pelosinus fermentans DSM 17108]SDR35210.1 hypothetical protein SAMN04515679_4188 [Pelosinus fermentans]
MENYELADRVKKSSNIAWALGGFGIVFTIVSLWVVDTVHKLYISFG